MLRYQLIEKDISIHPIKQLTEKQFGHLPELFEIFLGKFRIRTPNILLTLDITLQCCSLTCWGALKLHLSKHQR